MFQVFSWQPQASSHWWFGKPGEKLFTFLLFGLAILSHLFNPSVKFCGRVNMSRPNLAKSLKVLLIISIVYHLIFILLLIIIDVTHTIGVTFRCRPVNVSILLQINLITRDANCSCWFKKFLGAKFNTQCLLLFFFTLLPAMTRLMSEPSIFFSSFTQLCTF